MPFTTIYQSRAFTASNCPKNGLILSANGKQKGVRFAVDHPQYSSVLQCISSALDNVEFDALCSVYIYN